MILLANILLGLAAVLDGVLYFGIILIIARAVISWVNADPYNPIVRFIHSITDPLLRPLQRRIPLLGPGIDVSPIVAILLLSFLDVALVETIRDYATSLKFEAMRH